MMKKEMYRDSVSPDIRMSKYKTFAVAFSYPDEKFFNFFSKSVSNPDHAIVTEYDRLFRSNEIWLYCAEHLSENEFQKVQYLSDIMGFYKAFGVEPDKDRPDSLTCELEFMYYLIFKLIHADTDEKRQICISAQKKFFSDHLYQPGIKIARLIISKTENGFYKKMVEEFVDFLNSEKQYLSSIT